ncbi:MAG TPA: MATE family efflux transporter [Candidatus Bilophila faecipullorum]|uniref:Multidrug-efflux transporter n=1 Tax=Candidatus Bilophila faecipullorum TaxID=2838482 RepID=A0A9D1R1R1_9BACT|nr:MATE family efflux transporter [uncultured Bilophila sp.]HIW79669.1 MATE family efflux transporter [Candidatus Bilophila faecipullorum]
MKLNTERLHTIWHLTWPQGIMLLCQFVIGITDVWAGGRIGAEVQASIGLITQCHMMFMALAMAAVNGAVASISQSLGAGQEVRARRYVGLVVLGCIGIGAIIAAAASFWRVPILRIIQTPESILPTAVMFLTATIWGLPGQYALTIGAAVFRAAKQVLIPLYVTITACLLNVFGDLAFGLGWWGFPRYGAAGLAYSTLVSVTIGAALMLLLLVRHRLFARESFPAWRWIRKGAPYLLKVAGPAFGTSFLWQTGYMVLYVITASLPFGKVNALAGLTTGLRVESILFLPAVAFSMTASVLVGHALGEGNPREAKRTLLATLGIACAGMSLVGAAIWPWRMELAGLIAPDPAVQIETANYLSYNILAVPFTVASVVLAGGLNGAGATVYPLVSFSAAVWLVRLPIAWLFGHVLWQDAAGVYLSTLVSQVVMSLSLLWVTLRCRWTRFALTARHPSSR